MACSKPRCSCRGKRRPPGISPRQRSAFEAASSSRTVTRPPFNPSDRQRGDLKDGTVVLDKFGPAVPEPVRKKILAKKDEILKDSFVVWSGPMMAQDGKELLPAGKAMPMEQLESMQFFVKGVVGTIK